MFVFAIGLISKKVSQDWSRVVRLLEGTLSSIFNSSDQDFIVLIACHEIPNTKFNSDPRLQYLVVDFPPMMGENKPMLDRTFKYKAIGVELKKKYEDCFVMLMDADDLVSNKIVGYVKNRVNKFGYIIQKGYEYDYQIEKITSCPRFNLLCGSSIILNLSKSDLPKSLSIDRSFDETYFGDMIYNGHRKIEELSKIKYGRPLEKIPFYGGIYIINNGENHTNLTNNIGFRRKLFRVLSPWRSVPKSLADEFCIK